MSPKKISKRESGNQQKTLEQSVQSATSLRHAIYLLTLNWQRHGSMLRDQIATVKQPDSWQSQAVSWSERLVIRQSLIDMVLKTCVNRPLEQVQPELLCLLRMGSCELLLGPTDSQHAAISETVELCRNPQAAEVDWICEWCPPWSAAIAGRDHRVAACPLLLSLDSFGVSDLEQRTLC